MGLVLLPRIGLRRVQVPNCCEKTVDKDLSRRVKGIMPHIGEYSSDEATCRSNQYCCRLDVT